MKKIRAQGLQVYTFKKNENDYISLTDMARYKNPLKPKDVVKNWIRNYSTIEFLGICESINNPNFKGVELDSFKKSAGANSFSLTPKRWIEKTSVYERSIKYQKY